MSIKRKQEICLDAIEYSFSMANIAYGRIIEYCKNYADNNQEVFDIGMILDVWSFVDVAKRLRTLLQNTTGIKNADVLTRFLQETESIVDFRNYIQHLEEKTPSVSKTGRPIWGSVSWVQLFEDNTFKIYVYVTGRIAVTSNIPVVNPSGREFYETIDHFELTVGETTINISEIFRKINELKNKFDDVIKVAPQKIVKTESILSIDFDS